MLYDRKQEADELRAKLQRSERQRADQANQMAAHADTIQLLSSLRELAIDNGEGVLMYVRRPDEPQAYPIVVGKEELTNTDPASWWSEIIDPRARAVLDAADRMKSWMPADPAADQRMREDYAATAEVLQPGEGLLCEVADRLVTEREAVLKELHSLRSSEGIWRGRAQKLEVRVGELQTELDAAKQPEEEVLEDQLLSDLVGKHHVPAEVEGTRDEIEDYAQAAGPKREAVSLPPKAPAEAEDPVDAEAQAKEEAEREAEAKKERIAKRRKARKKTAEESPEKPAEPETPTPEESPGKGGEGDGLGPDEPSDTSEAGNLARGSVKKDAQGDALPVDPNAHQARR